MSRFVGLTLLNFARSLLSPKYSPWAIEQCRLRDHFNCNI